MFVPVLATLGVLTALYATRGPVADLRPGYRYLVGFPRGDTFPGLTEPQIRARVASTSKRGATVYRVTPLAVWLSIPFRGDEPGGLSESELLESWREAGAEGPYVLLFRSF